MRKHALVSAALLAAATGAHADAIPVKPGLWEQTTTIQNPGMAAPAVPPELANLPPEQRAQMEKMLGMMSGKPTVTQQCVTPEMLKEWQGWARQQSQPGCTHEVHESSPEKVSMTFTCEGGRTTGTMDFAVQTPERMTSTVVSRSRRESGEHTMRMESVARWLGADCGAVKPATPPKPE